MATTLVRGPWWNANEHFPQLSRSLPSPDPVAAVAGDRLHAAALLHDHVNVGFHDLCDLSDLATQGERRHLKHPRNFPENVQLEQQPHVIVNAPVAFQRTSRARPP